MKAAGAAARMVRETLIGACLSGLLGIGLAVTMAAPSLAEPIALSLERTPTRRLALSERIAAQRAIEQVQWDRRIWPEDNPQPKPSLSEVLPDVVIEERVRDGLRKSAALGRLWGRPLRQRQLQAELDRMARDTREPESLRRLFAALGDDPTMIAECLVRPMMADRLLRAWYARDERVHGELRRLLEREFPAGQEITDERVTATGGKRAIVNYRPASGQEGSEGGGGPDEPGLLAAAPVIALDASEWQALEDRLTAGGLDTGGNWSVLEEGDESFWVERLVGRELDSIELESILWPKKPFDTWWSEVGSGIPEVLENSVEGYVLPEIASGNCTDDTWKPTSWKGPAPRGGHTAVWTGTEMIVWGGACCDNNFPWAASGGRYDPALDSWTPTRLDETTPVPRYGHKAVWTGTRMLIYGGNRLFTNSPLGGSYDPTTDTWTILPKAPNESAMLEYHTAIWTGTEMIVWGGCPGFVNTGARYNPASNTWTATGTGPGVPTGRVLHTAVWTNGKMIIWGGDIGNTVFTNTGAAYNPVTDGWQTISTTGAPSARRSHTAVWTNGEMIVWGGVIIGAPGATNTGGRYKPATNSWTQTSTSGPYVPTPRGYHTAVWTGTEMIVWGGAVGVSGGRYQPSTDSWLPMSFANAEPDGTSVWTGSEMLVWSVAGSRYNPATDTWVKFLQGVGTGPAGPRTAHTMVWTGAEAIIWGGGITPGVTATGLRYDPMTDTWVQTPTGGATPASRADQSALWTGREMIVWGGFNGTHLNTGGRYDPQANTWTPTSTGPAVPTGRADPSAVWTGSEMLVWGGFIYGAPNTYLGDGARYDPVTDTWAAMSMTGAPAARAFHTAVWTGHEMIVWGGAAGNEDTVNTGGRYDPVLDSWLPTSLDPNVPSPRCNHVGVWSGSELLVWGGVEGDFCYQTIFANSGGRYDPMTDSWTPTAIDAATPSARAFTTGIWTGREMLVWGGRAIGLASMRADGGRYDPAADAWSATSLPVGAPEPRYNHTAVWTGSEMMVWGGETFWTPERFNTGGLYCAGPCHVPGLITGLTVAPRPGDGVTELSWPAGPDSVAYDVVRGGLQSLRATGGSFAASTDACLARSTGAYAAADPATPAASDGYWYLVRGVNCGAGSYDTSEPSQAAPRDAAIAASAASCP